MNSVCAVVVTYNRKKLLEENINALMNQTYKDLDILVVDNNSNDGTAEMLEKYKSEKLLYVNTGKNIGGSGGFNLGVRKAIEKKYDYCWLMDDDTIPNDSALEVLMKKTKQLNNEFSFLCSKVEWIDGTISKMNKPKASENWIENLEMIKHEKTIPVETCSFVSCFINLKDMKQYGLPIKEFFIYADDWEYTERIGKIKPAFLLLDSVVVHKMKENCDTNIINVPVDKIERAYYNYRNMFYIYKKKSKKSVAQFLLNCFCNIFKITIFSKDKKLRRIRYMLKGVLAGITFNPPIEFVEE